MITFTQVRNNPYFLEFTKQTERRLSLLKYTSHGLDHADLVAARARTLANEVGLGKRDRELAAIAALSHDIGNFLSRTYHNYLGATIFQQLFQKDFTPEELAIIMQAIVNHDKYEMEFTDPISAVVILADKSDVRRERVTVKDRKVIEEDIHNRVNFAAEYNKLDIDKKKKRIVLRLKIDPKAVSVMEYFEIFTERMIYCRKAAECLGYKFGLVINDFKLL